MERRAIRARIKLFELQMDLDRAQRFNGAEQFIRMTEYAESADGQSLLEDLRNLRALKKPLDVYK